MSSQASTRAGPACTRQAPDRISGMAIWSLVLSILTLGGIGQVLPWHSGTPSHSQDQMLSR